MQRVGLKHQLDALQITGCLHFYLVHTDAGFFKLVHKINCVILKDTLVISSKSHFSQYATCHDVQMDRWREGETTFQLYIASVLHS